MYPPNEPGISADIVVSRQKIILAQSFKKNPMKATPINVVISDMSFDVMTKAVNVIIQIATKITGENARMYNYINWLGNWPKFGSLFAYELDSSGYQSMSSPYNAFILWTQGKYTPKETYDLDWEDQPDWDGKDEKDNETKEENGKTENNETKENTLNIDILEIKINGKVYRLQ